jgi:hypothetical protein
MVVLCNIIILEQKVFLCLGCNVLHAKEGAVNLTSSDESIEVLLIGA